MDKEQEGHPIKARGCRESCPKIGSVVDPHAVSIVPGLSLEAFPLRLQLGVRLSRPLPALRTEELVHVKGLFATQHVIDGSSQFVSEYR